MRKKKSVQSDRKINHLLENTGWASLIYLILPAYKCIMNPINWETGALSIFIVFLALLRSFLGPFYRATTNVKVYVNGLYIITGFLTFSASILASGILCASSFEVVVLFDTVFVATMATGVMTAFSVEPLAAAVFGAFALFPFSLVLLLHQPTNSIWLLLGASVCHLWNMNQVNRTYKNFLKIQDSEETIKFQEHRLKEFIDTLPGYVSWFDNDLKYLDANEKLVKMCGLSKDEIEIEIDGSLHEGGGQVQIKICSKLFLDIEELYCSIKCHKKVFSYLQH